jgi:hypothetical protein
MSAMLGTQAIEGATGKLGKLMLVRTELIVLGIVACIVFFGNMIVTSYMSAKIKKTEKRGDVEDTEDLDKAYKWGWAASLVYGGMAVLSGAAAIALIVSLFF